MNTTYAIAAALAATLAAPALPAAAQVSDVQALSRNAARDARGAMRAFRDHYDQERQGPQQTETISKVFKVGKTGALDLTNLSGDVTVTGGAGEEIKVDAVKRVRARSAEDAKAGLEAIQVSIAERAGRVEVRTDYARRDMRGGVDYTIAVPAGATVLVKTMSGDVKVTGVKGELRAETISGDVTVAGGGQIVRAKAMAGDVVVSDVASDGDVSFSSMSGNVTARNIKARGIEVSSTSGDLSLIDVTCTRATASTMAGEVDFTGPLAKGGRYELRAHSGDVRLTPTATTGFEVEANTFSGTFRSDFPVTLRSVGPGTVTPPTRPTPPGRTTGTVTPPTPPSPPPPPAPPDRPGDRTTGDRAPRPPRMPGRSIQGTYGDGGAVLSLTSFSGNITIVKK